MMILNFRLREFKAFCFLEGELSVCEFRVRIA